MATSGTTNFTLDVGDIVDQAYRRAGVELRTGDQYTAARQWLDLLLAEIGNRGLNFWTITQAELTLTQGVNTYNLPSNCIDVIEQALRTNPGQQSQFDKSLFRMSMSDYAKLANKLAQMPPNVVVIDRQLSPQMIVYPTPDTTYVLKYYYLRRLQDAGSNAAYTLDAPVRFLPTLINGLAYNIAMNQPSPDWNRVQALQAEYERQFDLASGEDRDRASFFMRPGRSYY